MDLRVFKPMTRAQFGVVKIMQTMGIKPQRFARACNEAPEKMAMAYSAPSYERYITGFNMTEDAIDEFLRGTDSGQMAAA